MPLHDTPTRRTTTKRVTCSLMAALAAVLALCVSLASPAGAATRTTSVSASESCSGGFNSHEVRSGGVDTNITILGYMCVNDSTHRRSFQLLGSLDYRSTSHTVHRVLVQMWVQAKGHAWHGYARHTLTARYHRSIYSSPTVYSNRVNLGSSYYHKLVRCIVYYAGHYHVSGWYSLGTGGFA